MMKFSRDIIILFLLFLLMRLFFLFTFPPFTDESLYARWGALSVHLPEYRWAAMSYLSRQPLAMWMFGFGGFVFGHPIYGSRLVVLLANIPTFFLLFAVTEKLFSRKAAVVAAFLLAVGPLFILTQTLAMMDGLLFSLAVALLWLITRHFKGAVPRENIGVGFVIATGLWIKSTALLFIPLVLTGLAWKRITGRLSYTQAAFSILVMTCITTVFLIPLLVQPDFRKVLGEPGSFVGSPDIGVWITNMYASILSLVIYTGPVTMALAGSILSRMNRVKLTALAFWLILPVLTAVIMFRHVTVRYFIIGTPVIPVLLAACITVLPDTFRKKGFVWIFGGMILMYGIFFVAKPAVFFRMFPEVTSERQYAIGWTSGYGLPEAVSWINARTPDDKLVVLAVADTPGNPGDYILAYYYFRRDVNVIIATLTSEKEFRKLVPLAEKVPVHLVTRTTLLTPEIMPFLTPVILFPKPFTEDAVGIYTVSFPPEP